MALPSRSHAYSLDTLESMLLSRIETLAAELASDGVRRGHEWVARNPNRADNRLGSFSINLTNGKWSDFAADDRSSRTWPCLSLVAYLATGGRWKSEGGRDGAIRWSRDWLGLTDRNANPAERSKLNEMAERAARVRADEEKTRTEKKRLAAHRIWLEAKPLDGSDPASLYLKKKRGIDVTTLPGGFPGALRWTMTCRRYTGDEAWTEHPAMLAAMHREGVPGGFAAVHRTFLVEESPGVFGKAFGPDSKTMLGPKAGASIRLCKGPSGKPLSSAPDGEWIGIAEGIENALSAAIAIKDTFLNPCLDQPGLRIIAAGTLENIGKVVLPEAIEGVWLIADNDKPSADPRRPGPAEILQRQADLLQDRGLKVKIAHAPAGFKDFNAALMGEKQ